MLCIFCVFVINDGNGLIEKLCNVESNIRYRINVKSNYCRNQLFIHDLGGYFTDSLLCHLNRSQSFMTFWLCNKLSKLINEKLFKPILSENCSHFYQVVNWSFSNTKNNVWKQVNGDFLKFFFEQFMINHFSNLREKLNRRISDSPLFILTELNNTGNDMLICWIFPYCFAD